MTHILDICLKRPTKIYHDGDVLSGIFVVDGKGDLSHNGITLTVEGNVTLHVSSKSVGAFEALYNSAKAQQLLFDSLELVKPGKLPSGRMEIPFEVPIKPRSSAVKLLYETYHGVYINIQYTIKVDITRSMLAKNLQKSCEFIIQYRENAEKSIAQKLDFKISPSTIPNVKDTSKLPKFEIKGFLESATCCLANPFTGQLTVLNCEKTIHSIELQLVRIETCGCAEGYAKEATEIQNIQIADGNVCRNIAIPIYMAFPRLFTCPTISTNNFKIEFEVNVAIVFEDNFMVSENLPVKLTRY